MAPKRATSRAVTPERQDADGQRPGQEREAGLERAVVEHVLEVQRAEEERRVHAGDEQAAHGARARSGRAARRIRSGMIGFAMRDSRARKAAISATASAPKPSTWAEPQPWLVACTIA